MPDDSISVGYKQVKPFHFEQVFFSQSKNFTGTEIEFLANGLAYTYYQTSPFARVTPCKA
jgi:hypothetical protein